MEQLRAIDGNGFMPDPDKSDSDSSDSGGVARDPREDFTRTMLLVRRLSLLGLVLCTIAVILASLALAGVIR